MQEAYEAIHQQKEEASRGEGPEEADPSRRPDLIDKQFALKLLDGEQPKQPERAEKSLQEKVYEKNRKALS